MNSLFEDLKQGLNEAIAYEKGQGTARVSAYTIKPVKDFSNMEIRSIRMKVGMTQKVFASFMGVSSKTVEAWERGRIHPTGPAMRLLEMLEQDNEDISKFFVKL